MSRPRLLANEYIEGVLTQNRTILSRAITLVESQLASDKALAREVLEGILPHTGKSIRIGITGVPGVGKSTFIESFGKTLTKQQKRLAVLAIDPTSQLSKGSILGDKTRMEDLSREPLAYIRPSPASGSLGGVANRTRETMLLCEAAGFEVILIETVGVGQSETIVKGMTDFFLLLMLAGAGDELQGIKKGIMEMADAVVITKADGSNIANAIAAQAEYQSALHLLMATQTGWLPRVQTCSALENTGLAEVWQTIIEHQETLAKKGLIAEIRAKQNLDWMHNYIKQTLEERFYANPSVQNQLEDIEKAVLDGSLLAIKAAEQLLKN
jgi:LAO/AO transport system kinase